MKEKSTINERVLYIIDNQCSGNRKKFAEKIGFKPQVISNIVSGRKSKPSFDVLNAIKTSFVYINSEWLLTGKGEMLKEETEAIKVYKLDTDTVCETQETPLYDLEAVAGLRQLLDNSKNNIIDTIKIPNLPKCDGAVFITGDSMYPLLKSGDIVLYKEVTPEYIFWGEMYLLSVRIDEWEEYVTVKYIQKSAKGEEYIKLVSQNQHHQPKDISINNVTALALIKASIRINTMT